MADAGARLTCRLRVVIELLYSFIRAVSIAQALLLIVAICIRVAWKYLRALGVITSDRVRSKGASLFLIVVRLKSVLLTILQVL